MDTETSARDTPTKRKWAVKIEQRGLMQPVYPPQPSINTIIPLPQPLSFKSSTSSRVVDRDYLEAAEAAEAGEATNPPVNSDWTHWIQPYRHTRRSILLIRALLNEHFGLPTETISIVLDYADCWISTTAEVAANPHHFWDQNNIITMPPLGTDVIDTASGSKHPQMPLRGLNPCREIRVRMQVKSIQKAWSNPYCSNHFRRRKPLGNRPFIMGVVWKDDSEVEGPSERRNRDRVFDVSHLPSVFRAAGHDWERSMDVYGAYQDMGPPDPYAWSIPVVEEKLEKDKEEQKEVIWRWTDRSAGGDLIRALRAGDSLQLRTTHYAFEWGTVINRMEVEVLYTI